MQGRIESTASNEQLAEMRGVNARLVVVAVRAQELTEEAEKTSRLKDAFLATVDAVRPLATNKNVHLALKASSGTRAVIGDDARLQQVLWVVDTGQGISPDLLPHVVRLPIAAGTERP